MKKNLLILLIGMYLIATLSACSKRNNQEFSIIPETGSIGNSQWGMKVDDLLLSEKFTVDSFEEYKINDKGIGSCTTKPLETPYGKARLQYFFRSQNQEGIGRLDSVYYFFDLSDSTSDFASTLRKELIEQPVKELKPLYGDEGVPLIEKDQFWASEENLYTVLTDEQKDTLIDKMHIKNTSDLSDEEYYKKYFSKFPLWKVTIGNEALYVNGEYSAYIVSLNQ